MSWTAANNQNHPIARMSWISGVLLGGYLILAAPGVRAEPRYGVYVDGDSPMLLEIVQQVQPGAVFQEHRDRVLIDAGIYFDRADAEELVEDLRLQGIRAEITDLRTGEDFDNPLEASPWVVSPDGRARPVQSDLRPGWIRASSDLGLHQVYVSAGVTSLPEVRRVSPNAEIFNIRGRRVIQVGSFVNRFNAELMAEQLFLRGIPAEIIHSQAELEIFLALEPGQPVQPGFPTPLPARPGFDLGLGDTDNYFVLIRGQAFDLPVIAETAIALGVPQNSITIRDDVVDPLVAVGPFADRTLAREWENYLTDSGVGGTQLYFGR